MSDILAGYTRLFTYAGAATLSTILLLRILRGTNAIRRISGPPVPSWIFGNMLQLLLPDQYGDNEFGWQKTYGAAYRIQGCFGEDRLMLSDPAALQFIINNPKFEHSPVFHNLVKLLSDKKSLSVVKGETHKRLRAALGPSFSAAAIRQYQPAMEKAAEAITRNLENALDPSVQATDIYPLLATATLSAISEAVLGHIEQELIDGFVQNNTRAAALSTGLDPTAVLADAIGAHSPEWLWDRATLLPTKGFNILRKVRYLAIRIGSQILQDKMDAAQQGLENNDDIFTQLLSDGRSHQAKTRTLLNEKELLAQTSLLLVAGQEPAAHTLAFGLLELARDPGLQDSLRREIYLTRGRGSGLPYNSMPLLNAFIKEVLRLYPIGPLVERVAMADTIVPLAESIITSNGEKISQIPVRKGQIVNLAIASYQRLESLWGPDAGRFKPSRWIEGSTYRGEAIGPYANLLTFLGGARTCLGWRFAILEMQVIFCELVANFSFALPEGDSIRIRGSTLLTPINSEGKKGAPLRITRIHY